MKAWWWWWLIDEGRGEKVCKKLKLLARSKTKRNAKTEIVVYFND
jgi:hypothetical protein